jgi:xylulokinase
VDRHVLAIDLGTSALKVALVTMAGQVVASREEACRVRLLPGGGAEQDPERDWWEVIARAAGHLAGTVPAESVAAVCCTAQWSGTVPAAADGAPVRNAIIWMDSRGAPCVREVTGGPVRIQGYGAGKLARWIRVTAGLPSRSGKDSVAHILWLKATEPDTYSRTRVFLEPKDWLNLRLTGRAAATYDSIALHWVTDNRDPRRIRYDPRLLALAGLDPGKLPELIAATDVVGPLLEGPAAALGVRPGIPVVAGAPDLHSAAIGSGATRDFQAHLYVGTSSWITCHVPFKKTDIFRNIASLPSPIPGRYFVADEQETAGAALTFLRDRVLFPPGNAPAGTYRQFDEMDSGRGQRHQGRVPQPVAGHGPRGPGQGGVRGRGAERAVAAGRGGEVHRTPARPDQVHRRRRALRHVVTDLRRRARPHDRASRRPGQRERPRRRAHRRRRARRAGL